MDKCYYCGLELKNDGEHGCMACYVIQESCYVIQDSLGWGRGTTFCPLCASSLQLKEVAERVTIPPTTYH